MREKSEDRDMLPRLTKNDKLWRKSNRGCSLFKIADALIVVCAEYLPGVGISIGTKVQLLLYQKICNGLYRKVLFIQMNIKVIEGNTTGIYSSGPF